MARSHVIFGVNFEPGHRRPLLHDSIVMRGA
jgi:hypothetical protein